MNEWYLWDQRYRDLNNRSTFVLYEMAELEAEETGLLDEISRTQKFGKLKVLQGEYERLSKQILDFTHRPFAFSIPDLLCKNCNGNKKLIILSEHEFEQLDKFGRCSIDAGCPGCNKAWRYVFTPAIGWDRSICLTPEKDHVEMFSIENKPFQLSLFSCGEKFPEVNK